MIYLITQKQEMFSFFFFLQDDEFLTLPESDMLFDLIRIQKYIEDILNTDVKLNMKSEEKSVLAENETKKVTSSFPNPSEPKPSITSTTQQPVHKFLFTRSTGICHYFNYFYLNHLSNI